MQDVEDEQSGAGKRDGNSGGFVDFVYYYWNYGCGISCKKNVWLVVRMMT